MGAANSVLSTAKKFKIVCYAQDPDSKRTKFIPIPYKMDGVVFNSIEELNQCIRQIVKDEGNDYEDVNIGYCLVGAKVKEGFLRDEEFTSN